MKPLTSRLFPSAGQALRWPALAVTSALALGGLVLMGCAHWFSLGDMAFIVAALLLVAAFARTAITFNSMRALARGEEGSWLQDQAAGAQRESDLEDSIADGVQRESDGARRERAGAKRESDLENSIADGAQREKDGAKRESDLEESILRAAGEGISRLDLDGKVTFANPAAERMTGHTAGGLKGRYLHGRIVNTRANGRDYAEESAVSDSLEAGATHPQDLDVYWRKDGSSFPVEYTSTPIVESGVLQGEVIVFKDITDRQEAERAKDEFTAVVSHELRTPLTSIRGSLGLLESGVLGELPEKGQRMVEIAVENTDRLVRLINDILDVERINSGFIDMKFEPCKASELIGRAVNELAPVARDAHVELEVKTEDDPLSADPDRVHQALTNLISNAIKFSEAGSTVSVRSERHEGEVVFRVIDDGRGIPAEHLESIFERFHQVDASDSREKGGTGLGLSICRTILEHHGGRIWVESAIGRGSTFSFALPLTAGGDTGSHPDHEESPSPAIPAILVCDDDTAVVEAIGAMLARRGYRAIKAHSGQEAIDRAKAELPAAILLDLQMPAMSGWETAAALRQRPETAEIPIVVLSALLKGEADPPSGLVVGWVEKPLDEAVLFEALERALDPRRGEAYRVLIVEDDADLSDVLAAILRNHGVEAFTAVDGHAAIELSRELVPDLLVLDVNLPGVDGFEVVDWLRRDGRLSSVPVVVYTARDLNEANRERLRLGEGSEFLTKGRVTPADFEQCVLRLLGGLPQDRMEANDVRTAHPVG